MTTRLGDVRVQPTAYITDGSRLYEVLDVVVRYPSMKPAVRNVMVEDACSGMLLELSERTVLAEMTLVREAVPDGDSA